jgi:signal transduction histidine kinase
MRLRIREFRILSLWTPEEESREIVDALQKTGSWSGEVSGTRKDGSEIVVELAVSLVRDAHGVPVAMMGSFVDITERKAAEEALQTASKKLHLLSGITRHDILNQVMALQGYLDLTQREIDDPTLSRYHTEAEKAANAIQKQIEFTKVYEDLGVHAPTWQPLSPLIEVIDHTHPPHPP